jgi:Protein-tyrosine-phosphatase
MAEAVFNKILEREQATHQFNIDSAGLISVHKGELPDHRMRFHASKRGYQLQHHSRPVTRTDFDDFDLIICMDDSNYDGLRDKAHTLEEVQKIHRMTDYCRIIKANHVPDPYYGGDQGFENVIDLLEDACEGLFTALKNK